MASGNLSPRQRMINMMYLVLTALLALNVSKDILKAFKKVESSLSSAVENIDSQNQQMYLEFEKAAQNNPLKVAEWKEKAFKIKSESEILVKHISLLKDTLIEKTGGYDDKGELSGMDNLEKVANEMFKAPQQGIKLKNKINSFRSKILSIPSVSENNDLKTLIENTLNTDDVKSNKSVISWEQETFGNFPLIAVLTFLTKLQGDIVTIESKTVDFIRKNIGADDVKFSNVEAQVISPKNYVMEGDSFKASISLAAFDSTSSPMVIVTNKFLNDSTADYSQADTISVSYNGKGIYSVPAKNIGVQKRAAKILINTDNGIDEYERFFEYQVAQAMAVVSPTKMNVFYRGVSNPIDVSVPGFSPQDLEVSGQGVKIKKNKPGKYEATVLQNTKKIAKIIVKAQGKKIGKPIEFRIDRIPPPNASINGKREGRMSRAQLSRAQGIASKLTNFPFDLKYKVISYECKMKVGEFKKTFKKKGNKFDIEIKEKIKKLKPGSDITFQAIKAKGPDGVKTCPPIVLTVQ